MADQCGQLNDRRCTINVGSRNSQLALIQTESVIEKLDHYYNENRTQLENVHQDFTGGVRFNIIGMTTIGDRILNKALPDIGTKSVFTKDLEVALMEGKVDFIVHSLKDLPTTLPQGCVIGAILKRDNPNDAIVLKQSLRGHLDPVKLILGQHHGPEEKKNYIIGTSSHRRIAMVRRCNPELACIDIRGNLNTRLKKLDDEDGQYTALILAKAGLDRMGWADRVSSLLTPDVDSRLNSWLYAVGQGAIAVECRDNDKRIIDLLTPICDLKTIYETTAERSLMRKLEGGCSIPLGVRSSWCEERFSVTAAVLSMNGETLIDADESIDISEVRGSESNDPSITATGVVISDKIDNLNLVRQRIIACNKVGIDLANKMIDRGCLAIMRGTK